MSCLVGVSPGITEAGITEAQRRRDDMADPWASMPSLLLGTFTPRLDDKGRLILPAKYRPQLAQGLVMTRGQERCLYVLPLEEFRRMYEQIQRAPLADKQSRDYLRVFLSGAADEVPDKQGRITIPPLLRHYAGLDRDVTVIGAGTRIEVWDSAAWSRYLSETESQYAEAAEEVLPPPT